MLADTGHTGHLIAVTLLGLAGLGVLVSLVVQPPRTVPAATWRLIIGLVLMFTLAPATRFGYFMYPLGLWAWLAVSQLGLRHSRTPAPEWPGRPPRRLRPPPARQPGPTHRRLARRRASPEPGTGVKYEAGF